MCTDDPNSLARPVDLGLLHNFAWVTFDSLMLHLQRQLQYVEQYKTGKLSHPPYTASVFLRWVDSPHQHNFTLLMAHKSYESIPILVYKCDGLTYILYVYRKIETG